MATAPQPQHQQQQPKMAAVTPSASPAQVVKPAPFKLGSVMGASPWFKALIYGKPGSGKTELLGTTADVPMMNDVIYIDAEGGVLTVQENERIREWPRLLENRVPVTTFQEVSKVHDWLVGHCNARDLFLRTGDPKVKQALIDNEARLRDCTAAEIQEPKLFRSLLVDNITEIDAYSNYELLGVTEAKVLAGGSDDIDTSGWDEYKKNNLRMQMLLRAFRNLPLHCICACHEQYKQDEVKAYHFEPKLTGQLARQVQGFFDIVGRMERVTSGDKALFRLRVQPTDRIDAKNRRSVFKGDGWENPTMSTIMKQIGLLKEAA